MEIVVVLVRFFVRDVLFCCIFFWPGWLTLRVLTLGRYPRRHHREDMDWMDAQLIAFFGCAAIVLSTYCLVTLYRSVMS
jgi:hypothetical protein